MWLRTSARTGRAHSELEFGVTAELELAGVAFTEAVLPADVDPAGDEATEPRRALVQHGPSPGAWVLQHQNLPPLLLRSRDDGRQPAREILR